MARALVINPSILLLDEPFSNLDAKLRESTGLEMSRLQREFGLTSIFVTHDQTEAMSIADTIAVMKDGELQQLGSASEIYEKPANRFVADFIGRANFLPARIVSRDGGRASVALSAGITVDLQTDGNLGPVEEEGEILLRPEAISIADAGLRDTLKTTIEQISYQGSVVNLHGRLPDGTMIVAAVQPDTLRGIAPGDAASLAVKANALRWFPRR